MPLFRDGECPPLWRWSEMAQVLLFAASALFINLLIGFLISPFGFTDSVEIPQKSINDYGKVGAFLITTIASPFLETLIGQWLPLLLAKWAKRPPPTRILWSAVFFSILHISNGPASVIQTFFVGWVLASCFLFCRKHSWAKAYRVTSLAHSIHNLVVFILFLLLVQSTPPES